MKAIAVFNNKGGVGKTTLLCNVASYFKVKKEQRVLIVDADPQCNATIYLFSPERINQFYNNSTQKSLYHIIQPYKKEDFLSSEWISSKSGEERALDTTFAFKNLIQSLAQSYDYIFFDIGPSLGAINRSVLIACDYFIIPMSSDIFSIKAIENIAESLHEWKEDFNRSLSEYQRKEKATYTLNNTPIVFGLQFLGYVNQQYTIKRVEGQARPVKAYDNIIRRIPAKIATKLAEFTPDINQEQLAIGEIPNLHSLIPLSQAANKPIFRLAGKDGVVGAHFKKVSEFEDVIGKISDHILSNIQVYDNLLA